MIHFSSDGSGTATGFSLAYSVENNTNGTCIMIYKEQSIKNDYDSDGRASSRASCPLVRNISKQGSARPKLVCQGSKARRALISHHFIQIFGQKTCCFYFGAKFFTHLYIFAPKKAQKFNFLSFKTREKLFWQSQNVCRFFMSQKVGILPTVAWYGERVKSVHVYLDRYFTVHGKLIFVVSKNDASVI